MRPDPITPANDPVLAWAQDLIHEVVDEFRPGSVEAIAAAVGIGAASATLAALAAEGGVIMTTTIAATAASHIAVKAAAWGLAAALAVGGTAAVTGTLPGGTQDFAADLAARVGISLPRSEAAARASIDLDDVVTVEGAGRVGVRLDGDRLELTGIEANPGFAASIVSETEGAIRVEFRSAERVATVLLTAAAGEIVSNVTLTGVTADSAAEAEADAGVTIDLGG